MWAQNIDVGLGIRSGRFSCGRLPGAFVSVEFNTRLLNQSVNRHVVVDSRALPSLDIGLYRESTLKSLYRIRVLWAYRSTLAVATLARGTGASRK